MYLRLFNGRLPDDDCRDDWGMFEISFQVDYVHLIYGSILAIGDSESLEIRDNAIFYGGILYGDFAVNEGCEYHLNVQEFDQDLAERSNFDGQ